MTNAAMLIPLIPLILAGLFAIVAVHAEFARPGRFARLNPPRAPRHQAFPRACPAPVDPGAIVALSASECDRLYPTPPIATCARGAARL
jgi:hypothetical protein